VKRAGARTFEPLTAGGYCFGFPRLVRPVSGRSAPFEGSTNEEPSWRADAGILQVVILTISLWTYVPGNACTMLTQCCTPLKLGPFFLLYCPSRIVHDAD